MIRIDDDYYIDSDGRNYIVCRDLHKIAHRKNDDGTVTDYPDFQVIGYYGSLSGAVSGLAKYLAMQKFSAGEYRLWEAVEEIRKINKGLSDLIEKYEDDLK